MTGDPVAETARLRTAWNRGFAPDRRRHLADLESRGHFWFGPRWRLVERLVERFAGDRAEVAVDLGCGSGSGPATLARRARSVLGLDGYPASLRASCDPASVAAVCGDVVRLPIRSGSADLLLALDVAEHVDAGALFAEAHRIGGSDAVLVVSVPAFPVLWSELDEAAGHRCRYRRRQLITELGAAGWRVVHSTHYQLALFPLVWVVRRWPKRTPRRIERRPPRWLNSVLGVINRLEVAALHRMSLPWGSSLLVVARSR